MPAIHQRSNALTALKPANKGVGYRKAKQIGYFTDWQSFFQVAFGQLEPGLGRNFMKAGVFGFKPPLQGTPGEGELAGYVINTRNPSVQVLDNDCLDFGRKVCVYFGGRKGLPGHLFQRRQ